MNREELWEQLNEHETIVFDNPSYGDALVGITMNGRAVYDYQKMIESLMYEEEMSYEDAVEFIDYNTIRSLPFVTDAPIIVNLVEEDNEANE